MLFDKKNIEIGSICTASVHNRRQLVQRSLAFGMVAAGISSSRVYSQAKEEDEWIIAQTGEAGSMNPLADFSVAGLTVHAHLYDPLVDFEGPDLTLVPKLATEWEMTDEKVWTFTLREGVKWHDGKEFTGEDVKFTLEESATDPGSTRQSYVSAIESVEVVDPLTVRITTSGPSASLLASLSYIYILPQHVYQDLGAEQFGTNPIGTGAYVFDSWTLNEQLITRANEGYWGGVPEPKRIVYRPILEAATRLAELQTGGVQIAKGVTIESAAEIESDPDLNLVVASGVRQVYYPFQARTGALQDPRVRQAINFAVDRESIVEFLLEGYGEVRTGPLAPSQMGYNAEALQFTYDPERARSLLEEAGATDLELTWDMTNGVVIKDVEIAQFVANQLGEVGINVNINILDSAQLLDRYRAGNFQMTQTTWSVQTDPDSVISGLRIESSVNNHYDNSNADEIIQRGRQTLDPEERELVYQELYSELVENPFCLYIHAQSELYGSQAGVDWAPFAFAGNAGMTYFNSRD